MKHLALLLTLSLFSTTLLGQNKLGYHLEKNSVFTIKQDAQQIITQELDGASHVLTNKISGILEFTVENMVDNNYELSMVFKDLNLKISSSIQGELMNIQAKEIKEGDMQSKIFHSLLNTPVKMILAKTGDILEVTGGDSLVTRMTKASGLEDDFSKNMMKKSLEKEFGSDALSKSYEQMTFIYPTVETNIGDSWENKYEGKLSTTNTWTLKNLTKDTTTITGTADVVMNITEPATTMNLTGTQSTLITANPNNGVLIKMTVEGDTKGVSTMVQMSDQEIPTTIKSTITYELIQ
ncbi:DUF6263 family protein [uncultured Maribacter sp.]|uniref:DUF6263 family protein n=1 Tax=uncultured Maribacter sp. TaxID=431308 RepID=UPI002631CCC7|nr:DUF6263 family protein [uncultured Maribacter sp.]